MKIAISAKWSGLPLATLALGLAAGAAHPEDVDVYAAPVSASGAPNVLIVVDNTVNALQPMAGASRLAALGDALASAVEALADVSGPVNVGLMLFNAADGRQAGRGTPTGVHDGAYVRRGLRPMSDATSRTQLAAVLRDLPAGADPGAFAHYALALEEARRYFGGLAVLNGNNTAALADPSAQDAARARYVSPVAAGDCARNFILFIAAGPPAPSDAPLAQPLVLALNGGETPMTLVLPPPWPAPPLPASQSAAGNWFDEYAGLLRRRPYTPAERADGTAAGAIDRIALHAIALHDPEGDADNTDAAASARALLLNAAIQGGGRYRDATGPAALANQVTAALAEFNAVNGTLASPVLPAAVHPVGVHLNQVYMGMFAIDGRGFPRWTGNLKQYRFAYRPGVELLELVDAADEPALSAATGFIVPTARSHWSTARTTGPVLPAGSATVDFFSNAPEGGGLPSAAQRQEAPDGEVVDKGGSAQRLRAALLGDQSRRRMLTCPVTGCAPGASLASAAGYAFDRATLDCAAHATLFGIDIADCPIELPRLIDWMRGADNAPSGNELRTGPGGLGSDPVRPSIHGDVLHSTPALVNHGAAGVVAYYGANDGTLRAVRAGSGADAGAELWSFVAPESFAKLRRLREGVPALRFPSPSSGSAAGPGMDGARPRDYFFDGPVTHYEVRDAAGNATQALLFAAARRGGTFVYAFDVTVPESPKFLWRHAARDGSDAAFDDLALTFSAPRPARVAGYDRPVVVFGGGYPGGYDASGAPIGEDAEPAMPCGASPAQGCGNRIYVLDAMSGAVVETFRVAANGPAIGRGIVADVALVDTRGAGVVDRAYAADAGGTLWRIDFDPRGPAAWRLYQFAVAGTDGTARKFLQPPDVVVTRRHAAVLVGSGDREKPLRQGGADRFYMLKDRIADGTVAASDGTILAGWPIRADETALDNMADVTGRDGADPPAALDAANNNGWYYTLAPGEKVVTGAVTAAGIAYFSTHAPAAAARPGACVAPFGTARAYGLRFENGLPGRDADGNGRIEAADAAIALVGGGLPPGATGGLVQVVDPATGADLTVPYIIGAGGMAGGVAGVPSAGAPARIRVDIPRVRRKTYWYEKPVP